MWRRSARAQPAYMLMERLSARGAASFASLDGVLFVRSITDRANVPIRLMSFRDVIVLQLSPGYKAKHSRDFATNDDKYSCFIHA